VIRRHGGLYGEVSCSFGNMSFLQLSWKCYIISWLLWMTTRGFGVRRKGVYSIRLAYILLEEIRAGGGCISVVVEEPGAVQSDCLFLETSHGSYPH